MFKRTLAAIAIAVSTSCSPAQASDQGPAYKGFSDQEMRRECVLRHNLLKQVSNMVRAGAQPENDVAAYAMEQMFIPREWVNQERLRGFVMSHFYDAYHDSSLLVMYVEMHGFQSYVSKCMVRPDVFYGKNWLDESPILNFDAIPESQAEVDHIMNERGLYR